MATAVKKKRYFGDKHLNCSFGAVARQAAGVSDGNRSVPQKYGCKSINYALDVDAFVLAAGATAGGADHPYIQVVHDVDAGEDEHVRGWPPKGGWCDGKPPTGAPPHASS